MNLKKNSENASEICFDHSSGARGKDKNIHSVNVSRVLPAEFVPLNPRKINETFDRCKIKINSE